MYYPNLEINIKSIYKNTKEVVERAKKLNITVTAVTKCTGGNIEVAETFKEAGAYAIGESRIDNLKALAHLDISKWLIRIPMISEVNEAVQYSNVTLNSELKVLEALNKAAQKHHQFHQVILMIDHGDLREGWFDLNQFYKDLKEIKKLDYLQVIGIGTNSNCAGAVIPEPETFNKFPEIVSVVQDTFSLEKVLVSGGNSGAYYMIEDQTIPPFINNLRIGELLLFGAETSYQIAYPYLNSDIFKLNCELIEIKEKPSFPIGKHGKDAFGKIPTFEDKGIRKRGILAIGKQDIPPEDLIPFDKNISIITASSDHLLVDLTESEKQYEVGDILSFKCTYGSALRASTSDYVKKIIIDSKK